MFKTTPIIVMAALCLNFNSRAQSQKTLPLLTKQAILGEIISATTGEALPGEVIKTTTTNHRYVPTTCFWYDTDAQFYNLYKKNVLKIILCY